VKGITVAEYTFKKNHPVVPLDHKSALKIEGVTVQIDPQLLFQRLTVAANATNRIEEVFRYKLCSYPPALFDSSLMLRHQQKTTLANSIWITFARKSWRGPICARWGSPTIMCTMVTRKTHGDICTIYTDYVVVKKYGEAIVVFDGHETLLTKDMAHKRRAKG